MSMKVINYRKKIIVFVCVRDKTQNMCKTTF